jgi:hypothetical protein
MRRLSRRDILRPLLRQPSIVLGPAIVAQWIAIGVFSTIVRHNGWLYYQGGDQTFFYTDSWTFAHGHIPESKIGYAWVYVLAPIARIVGPNVVAALPAIVLLQVVLLGPIAVLSVYGIGARIGGRLVGYVATTLWIFGPYVVVPLWDHRYHAKYVEQFLPQALGLSGLGDYPSTVTLLVAAYFCIRALDTHDWIDGALGGIAAGFAFGLKPANVLFLAAPAVAFTLARRPRVGAAFTLALAPAAVTLAIWKLRGLGHLPIIWSPPQRQSAIDPLLLPLPLAAISHYVHFDWSGLRNNFANFREFFWSVRVIEWLPLAGAVGVARRSFSKSAFLVAWFGTFFVVKGSSTAASVEEGTFLRLFMPGFPPFLLLTAAIPLLLPSVGPRLADRFRVETARIVPRSKPVVAAAALFALVPLLLVLVFQPLQSRDVTKYFVQNVDVPVDPSFDVSVTEAPDGQQITWRPPRSAAARVFYRVFRAPTPQLAWLGGNGGAGDPTLPKGIEGIRCLPPTGGAKDCRLEMELIGTTTGTSWVDPDHPLPAGRWTYRVGLSANWLNDLNGGDVMLLSRPVTISSKRT